MIGYGENVGSGFPSIISAWKNAHWGEPRLMNKIDVDEVELILPVPLPEDVSEGVSNGVSKEMSNERDKTHNSLNNRTILGVSNGVSNGVSKEDADTSQKIFELIKNNPNINRNELSEQIGVSLKNIQKHINKLKQIGYIKRIGSPKYGHWEVIG